MEEMMTAFTRRTFLTGSACTLLASPLLAQADDRLEYKEYPFTDWFAPRLRGSRDAPQQDIDIANGIANRMPTNDHFEIMRALSGITDVGTTGELFNMRWKTFGNPLIVRFFHDIGYRKTPYPGDCTPWCAATVSWCLKRAGKKIPRDPASSQSYLRYGQPVTDPRPGDIVVFTNIGDRAHGHVALFLSKSSDTVEVLGGNQLGQSETNCGPGYRKSKITPVQMAINPTKSRAVSIHYLAGYFRPV
jgi:uncharacterized protein (TIGR02594 family)